ncbi:DUF456 domain-containing protein [Actinotalea ferrariae]|uniref:DUF456 domain-containing protein n=1 Tax=Actinotalea ferrariae TaxID=1386098 RepID=UPI001C8BD7F8|nr:DUF456 domain-containing protein [Actinotalea ferrariae]MBX9245902.1 DUF456 domain-containing protein [Actinotalea ferrariae]
MDLVTQLVGLAILVGLVGIVVPVLPGSLLIAVAVLVWALDSDAGAAWAVFAVVLMLLAVGWAATYVVAGKRVSDAGVPRRSIVVAGLAGIVGFFVIPVVGLLVFFPLALFGMEYVRLQDVTAARRSAFLAVRATALGMLVELGLACAAAATWLVAVLVGVGR